MDYHGEFESDDERALVHIPMAMRYRLDKSGIKLTSEAMAGTADGAAPSRCWNYPATPTQRLKTFSASSPRSSEGLSTKT